MKILIVSFYYAPELGAAPSRITNMARGLAASGDEVEVLTCLPNYPKGKIFDGYAHRFSKHEEIDGVKVHRYWTYATVSKNPLQRVLSMCSYSVLMWAFAWHSHRIRHYDRIIVQSPPIMVACSAFLLFCKLFRRKVLLNVSDLWPLSAVELGAVKEGSFYHKVLLLMERFIYKHATAIQGQSGEILQHIEQFVPDKRFFLYRNLQPSIRGDRYDALAARKRNGSLRIVYAGLLGVAQNLLSIIEKVNFKALRAELHLFGGGSQTEEITSYLKAHDCAVTYHGYLPKEKMREELMKYDASLVPLSRQIYGAVPSKIFDLLSVGVPILLCGSGESAEIVRKYGLGWVSAPGDIDTLRKNICELRDLQDKEYERLRENCLRASGGDFSYESQMKEYRVFLEDV